MPGGGSKSSSQTSTDKSTKVETNTTTTIRDIGFTGDDAIELAALVQEGIIDQTNAVVSSIVPILSTARAQSLRLADLSPEAQIASIELEKTPQQILSGRAPLIIIAVAGALFAANRFLK